MAGVKIVPSAPVSRTSVTGIPLADKVTIGALRRVATVVSPKRTAAQPPAAATGCWAAPDTSAIVTIAPLSHRFIGEEVTFGAALCKESNITVSSLLSIATLRACLRGPRAISNLAIPHAGPRPLSSRSSRAGVGVSETVRSTDFSCGGSTGERTDNANSYRQHAPAARSRRPFRPPHPAMEPQDGAVHYWRPQRDSYHRPRT